MSYKMYKINKLLPEYNVLFGPNLQHPGNFLDLHRSDTWSPPHAKQLWRLSSQSIPKPGFVRCTRYILKVNYSCIQIRLLKVFKYNMYSRKSHLLHFVMSRQRKFKGPKISSTLWSQLLQLQTVSNQYSNPCLQYHSAKYERFISIAAHSGLFLQRVHITGYDNYIILSTGSVKMT